MTNFKVGDDIIDSRYIIERIEELEIDKDNYEDENMEMPQDEQEELEMLRDVAAEGSQYSSDWIHGESLIHDSYFTEYAIEMLKDCGDLPREIPWYVEIDEEATAENIRQDYTEIDIDGSTYWMSTH